MDGGCSVEELMVDVSVPMSESAEMVEAIEAGRGRGDPNGARFSLHSRGGEERSEMRREDVPVERMVEEGEGSARD